MLCNEVVSSRRDHVAGSITRVLIKYQQLANNNTNTNYNIIIKLK